MKSTLLFSFLLILILTVNATIVQVSGDVSGTWDTDTVQVIDNLRIPHDQSLIINPGVKVIFDGYYKFNVEGQVMANGMINDSISFYVTDTTGLYNMESTEGAWAGFWFEPSASVNDSSVFEFCNFKYSKAVSTDSVYWYGGAICSKKYSKLRVSNCSFSNNIAYKNGGAIYCWNSSIKIEHCDFRNNAGGTAVDFGYGGAVCLEYSDAKVYKNYFTKNSSTGVGGGLSFEYSNPDIVGNVFLDNRSAIGGGLCGLRSEQGYPILNNLFENNSSTFFGGGVAFLGAHSSFANNTIVNNFSMYAGGLYFNAGAKSTIKNCIIWNNSVAGVDGPQIYVYDVHSAPLFYYNDIEGGYEAFGGEGISNFLGVYEDNIDLDPDFVGHGDHPYSLLEDSPCINSGTPDTLGLALPILDLAGNTRFMEEHIDMGCYENQGNSGVHNIAKDEIKLSVFPNPISDRSILNLNILGPCESEITVMNTQGKTVFVIPIKNYNIGNHQIHIPENILNNGLYFLRVNEKNSNRTKTVKLIVH